MEISQQNPDLSEAWQIALEEAVKRCKLLPVNQDSDSGLQGGNPAAEKAEAESPGSPKADSQLVIMIRMTARKIVFQIETQARANFRQLDRLVDYVSKMPGRRTIILVSPGFLSPSERDQSASTIDRAVRSQVVISSLDPRGLAPPKESDASRSSIFGRPGSVERLDSQREIAASDVLAEVAQDTGGEYFRNNNDLKARFGALAGSPVYYMLAFAPTNIKHDGKFHALKVDLVEKHKGFSVQARRGYFAPENAAAAEAETKRQAASDSDGETQELIREAVFSKMDSRQLPIQLSGKLSEGHGGTRDLSIVTHLDATPLHFQKEGKQNVNTVTFAFAVFDGSENLVASQQKQTTVSVLDAQLPELFKGGVTMRMNFDLKPGTYRIREVVMDSEEHHLTALSTKIEVP